jgi:quercetin dioxygenase-like cupin family protein
MKYALLCLALLTAQAAAPEVEITNEPHHHLTFENKSVRVFNVEVAPKTETQIHWHRHDYIAVTLGPAEISNAVKDKPPATVKFAAGDTRFASATFAHFVRATGPEPFRNVTVELLEDESLRTSSSKWDEDRALDVLPNGTKQILFVRDAIRATEFELQPGAVIPKHHHPGPYLVIAVTDLDLRSDIEGQPPTPTHFKFGDSKWLPGNYSHTITNTAAPPAKFVTLEFP